MVLANLGNVSLPLFKPHNLNHVSVFLLTLRLSCLPLCWPVLAYRSPHLYPTRCVCLSTYVILSFLNLFSFLFALPPIVSFFYTSTFCCFCHSPPTPCRSLFTFSTLELFSVLPLLFCGRTDELDCRGQCASR